MRRYGRREKKIKPTGLSGSGVRIQVIRVRKPAGLQGHGDA
jgi:hypothetical protein